MKYAVALLNLTLGIWNLLLYYHAGPQLWFCLCAGLFCLFLAIRGVTQ